MGGVIDKLVAEAKERCARDGYTTLLVKVEENAETAWRYLAMREYRNQRYFAAAIKQKEAN